MTKILCFHLLGQGWIRIRVESDPNYVNSDPQHCFKETLAGRKTHYRIYRTGIFYYSC